MKKPTLTVMDSAVGENATATLTRYNERMVLQLSDRQIVLWRDDILEACEVIEISDAPSLPPNATNASNYRRGKEGW